MTRKPLALLDRQLLGPALLETFKKLDPRTQVRNPVMFIVYAGTLVTTLLLAQALAGHGEAPTSFILSITIWLAFTVLFANFAEALAEGRSRAQASTLRDMRQLVMANKLTDPSLESRATVQVQSADLRKGDLVRVQAGEVIPVDGEVIEGAASVDESAITGSRHRSSASREAISPRSPEAHGFCRIGSSCRSPSIRATPSSTG